MKVRDLKDLIGTPYPRPFLYCNYCGEEYSANAGDYFMSRPETVLMCCDEPMERVRRESRLISC